MRELEGAVVRDAYDAGSAALPAELSSPGRYERGASRQIVTMATV